MEYRIEIRTSAGALVEILENAFDIIFTEAVNVPKTLTFCMPSTDRKLHYVTKGDEYWVREVESDEVIGTFKMFRQEDIH